MIKLVKSNSKGFTLQHMSSGISQDKIQTEIQRLKLWTNQTFHYDCGQTRTS